MQQSRVMQRSFRQAERLLFISSCRRKISQKVEGFRYGSIRSPSLAGAAKFGRHQIEPVPVKGKRLLRPAHLTVFVPQLGEDFLPIVVV
jgi:hypothetical protein